MEKVIITAALTGGGTIPTQSPYIPITPEEIAQEAKRAADAGAAIVHIHPRDPKEGFPTGDVDIYREIHTRIKEKTDAVVCTSTGVSRFLSAEQRIAAVPLVKPEMASISLGSTISTRDKIAQRFKDEDFKYDWEKKSFLDAKNGIFANSVADIEHFYDKIVEAGAKPEFEIFDFGWLGVAKYLMKSKGNYPEPLWLHFVTGAFGTYPARPDYFPFLKNGADDLFGKDGYLYSVIGIGFPHQFNMAAMSLMMGGHVRVGLEDNLLIEKGVLAKSNAEQVEKAVRLAREFGREIASPAEARQALKLKGIDKVNY